MSEFDLINQYFKSLTPGRSDVILGIGDDCALLAPPPGMQLALSSDTLNAGVHFPPDTHPEDIGYKALAVNLSDLASMGAKPAWASLNLSLPEEDHGWLEGFCRGFGELAQIHGVQLVGGDTTRGPLSISLQVTGFVEPNKALRRDGAQVGDRIFVSGSLGDAGLGLKKRLEQQDDIPDYCVQRLNRPEPRVALGQSLLSYSHCAIDVSDGLIADLGHILQCSGLGARIELQRIPLSQPLMAYYAGQEDWSAILTSGDDYELCFTVAEDRVGEMQVELNSMLQLTEIGVINETQGLQCIDVSGQAVDFGQSGYNHFRT